MKSPPVNIITLVFFAAVVQNTEKIIYCCKRYNNYCTAKAKLSKAQGHLYYGVQQHGLQPIGSGHVGSCCSCVEWRCWGASDGQVVAGVRRREPAWPSVLHWHCSKIKVNWKRKEKKKRKTHLGRWNHPRFARASAHPILCGWAEPPWHCGGHGWLGQRHCWHLFEASIAGGATWAYSQFNIIAVKKHLSGILFCF